MTRAILYMRKEGQESYSESQNTHLDQLIREALVEDPVDLGTS